MKKILLTIIAVLSLYTYTPQAHAVLCLVNTSDPRYKVASYYRNQTSCKNTQYANASDITNRLLVSIIVVNLLIKFLDHIQNEDKKEEFINTLRLDKSSKVYHCYGKEIVEVITTDETAYILMNNQFEKLPKFSSGAFQQKVDRGVIRFDLDRNMMLVQEWGWKTAKGGKCEYKGFLKNI